MTLAERKVMGAMQRRVGPNKVGISGVLQLQPFADGFKLILKETIIPLESSNWVFLAAPFLTFFLALLNWVVLPLNFGIAISESVGGGILIIIAISELSIYGVILPDWVVSYEYEC